MRTPTAGADGRTDGGINPFWAQGTLTGTYENICIYYICIWFHWPDSLVALWTDILQERRAWKVFILIRTCQGSLSSEGINSSVRACARSGYRAGIMFKNRCPPFPFSLPGWDSLFSYVPVKVPWAQKGLIPPCVRPSVRACRGCPHLLLFTALRWWHLQKPLVKWRSVFKSISFYNELKPLFSENL